MELLSIWQLPFVTQVISAHEVDLRILQAGRHPQARVRLSAIQLAPELAKDREAPWIESAVLSSLYDPDREVLRAGINAVGRMADRSLVLADAVNRFEALMSTQTRTVRRDVVSVVRRLDLESQYESLLRLIERATQDRSWIVRFEAYRQLQEEPLT
jgi:hypothetical protein